ncbi:MULTISPECIES: DUF3077 domain-containing protein [Pseudomonas]|uniref:Uncharacterized protein n=1 Tax=Pseudomonas putida TaxID=303 RepID=A0A7U6M6W7_PSEPU|nr:MULTISPECIES: DUF3077 domain-containing protein [Pseudomonas]MCJ7849845.1 DUF3077 domain-containing protein [Pseudomonas monteilii]MDD2126288.1 DUF3077 domain-containing protein [Pseudomonas monteilii]MDI3368660.1 DUF3077 domain-containing protein [Pseudomonas sp. V104_10]BBU47100.1 hypothetical protein PPTS312_50150 [Pseudomonas putida]
MPVVESVVIQWVYPRDAREQSSEWMGYVRELIITRVMDEKPMMIWATHYPSAMAKALMDDAELGMRQ